MEKLPHGQKSVPFAKTVIRLLMPYRQTIKTITTDNGTEFATIELSAKLWERLFILQIRTAHGKKDG